MLKILMHTLIILSSVFMLSVSMQSFAADKVEMTTPPVQISNKVNINQASSEDLAMIKGIGPTKAQAIVDYRESNGKFNSTDELINVKGIGRGTLQKIEAFISI
tara:strand:- start:17701 stop:18012 length:312 start_codon:yes stop_codon:yes gene_type:complete